MIALGQANSLVWKARLEAYNEKLGPMHNYLCKVNEHIEAQMTEVMQSVIGTKDEEPVVEALYETSAEVMNESAAVKHSSYCDFMTCEGSCMTNEAELRY